MPTLNQRAEGIDLSNYQGKLTAADVAAIKAAGKQFAIIRSSDDVPGSSTLAYEQMYACQDGGLPAILYAWIYPSASPQANVRSSVAQAIAGAVGIVALDFETNPVVGFDPIAQLADSCAILRNTGIIPIIYTDPNWWQSNKLDLSPLGDVRWWIADWNGNHDLDVPSPYRGARIRGHQYNDTDQILSHTFDSDVWVFDAEMMAAMAMQEGSNVTEDDIRAMVRDEMDKCANSADAGASMAGLLGALVARDAAAARALDPQQPIPQAPVAAAFDHTDASGPSEAYPSA